MSKRQDRKDEALKARLADHQAQQRENLITMVNSLPRGAIGGQDYEASSLSDQITNWQVQSGLREPEDRGGLSVGQKNLLFNAGMASMSRGQYAEGTQFDAQGNAYQPGMLPGSWIPALPNKPDRFDFERGEKEQRGFEKASERAWPLYRALYPDDHPDDVETAFRGLLQTSGMSFGDLNHIADDADARRAAFEQIHSAAVAAEYDREYGGYATTSYGGGGDDYRTDMLGGGAGGHTTASTHTQSYNEYEPGSLSASLVALQKKQGL